MTLRNTSLKIPRYALDSWGSLSAYSFHTWVYHSTSLARARTFGFHLLNNLDMNVWHWQNLAMHWWLDLHTYIIYVPNETPDVIPQMILAYSICLSFPFFSRVLNFFQLSIFVSLRMAGLTMVSLLPWCKRGMVGSEDEPCVWLWTRGMQRKPIEFSNHNIMYRFILCLSALLLNSFLHIRRNGTSIDVTVNKNTTSSENE